MFLIYNKNWIKDFSKDKPDKLVSVPFERSSTLNVLTNSSDKSPSIVLKEVSFLSESGTKFDLYLFMR